MTELDVLKIMCACSMCKVNILDGVKKIKRWGAIVGVRETMSGSKGFQEDQTRIDVEGKRDTGRRAIDGWMNKQDVRAFQYTSELSVKYS